MTRRRIMSEEAKTQIAELRENMGWSYQRIATKLGVHPGSVSWWCHINGVERYGKPRPKRNARPGIVMRNGFPVRSYTEADDKQLLELEKAGLNYGEIAERMGRKRNSIIGRLATLARHEAASESG